MGARRNYDNLQLIYAVNTEYWIAVGLEIDMLCFVGGRIPHRWACGQRTSSASSFRTPHPEPAWTPQGRACHISLLLFKTHGGNCRTMLSSVVQAQVLVMGALVNLTQKISVIPGRVHKLEGNAEGSVTILIEHKPYLP